ncbi:MAG: DUF411 domain-containing protein [Gammaproteobacteria bacterium]|nr:DUF411 domain-containing protein [Gammaproteobacteria bacterium]
MNNKIKIFSSAFLVLVISIYIGFNLPGKTAEADTIKEEIMVYKSPTCGCCKKWVKHLEREGFKVTTKNHRDMKPIKKMFDVQPQFQSCHTAKVGKYFIEGHVSASDIKKLLKEKPDIKGLTAPGMPMGSPGMEGHRKDKYDVLAIDKNNKASVYSKH